jgi:Transposase DDE domain/Transposase domain (DUF772)
MYKDNKHHLQPVLVCSVNELPEEQRECLDTSWAGVFYREFFCRLDEDPFAVLYADMPSRPNYPVNVLVGLEYLKAGFGWSDKETYEAFLYNMQVRYALGYDEFGKGYFDLRTLYYFRERLSRYMQEKGINLLDQAFEQVTDQQIVAFQIKTKLQRMDSTQVASNIRRIGRVQLLVEVLQRVQRMLNESDQERYTADFAPYMQGHAGQYVYHMKTEETDVHLQRIGEFMQRLLVELQRVYADEPVYQVLWRVFGEHFQLEQQGVVTKTSQALSATSLQSPDDLEATYREKQSKGYQGYVANVSETCDPQNPLQLITKVQLASNATDDSQLLAEALPDLKERTELDTIYTDGGHGGPDSDVVLQEQKVEHIQTAIRGRTPDPDKLHLADFAIKFNPDHQPVKVTCPNEQTEPAHPNSQKKNFVARFNAVVCSTCPLVDKCPAQPGKRDPRRHVRFTQAEAHASERRRRSLKQQKEGRNLRAAVEATMRSIKHPFPAGKLPVRGKFRMASMVIGSAAVSNVRRIDRYLQAKSKKEMTQVVASGAEKSTRKQARDSFWAFVSISLVALCGFARPKMLAVSC